MRILDKNHQIIAVSVEPLFHPGYFIRKLKGLDRRG